MNVTITEDTYIHTGIEKGEKYMAICDGTGVGEDACWLVTILYFDENGKLTDAYERSSQRIRCRAAVLDVLGQIEDDFHS